MSDLFLTGQLSPSKIEGCPFFTPVKISEELLEGLRVDEYIKIKSLPFLHNLQLGNGIAGIPRPIGNNESWSCSSN